MPFHLKGGEHGTDRWYGRPRGPTLEKLLTLPRGAPYQEVAATISPTQIRDPLRMPGWVKVIIGLADSSRGDLAGSTLRWVEECAGIRGSLPLYSAVLTAYEKSGLWQQALELHEGMLRKAVAQDVASYSAAVTACAKGSQWVLACDLLTRMQQPSRSQPKTLKANTVTFNAVIDACAKGSQWRAALKTLLSMYRGAVRLDAISFNSAIDACLKAGQTGYAKSLFGSLAQERIKPNYVSAILKTQLDRALRNV